MPRLVLLLAVLVAGTAWADEPGVEPDPPSLKPRIFDNLDGAIQAGDRHIWQCIRGQESLAKLPRALARRAIITETRMEYWLFGSMHGLDATWDFYMR